MNYHVPTILRLENIPYELTKYLRNIANDIKNIPESILNLEYNILMEVIIVNMDPIYKAFRER